MSSKRGVVFAYFTTKPGEREIAAFRPAVAPFYLRPQACSFEPSAKTATLMPGAATGGMLLFINGPLPTGLGV